MKKIDKVMRMRNRQRAYHIKHVCLSATACCWQLDICPEMPNRSSEGLSCRALRCSCLACKP